MKAQQRGLLAAIGIFTAGVGVGIASAGALLEQKIRTKYDEKLSTMKNAYEQSLNLRDQKPVTDYIGLAVQKEPEVVVEEATADIPVQRLETENPYHKAVTAVETSVEVFVDGGVNDYGVSYIEEEEYLDEDGRFKGKIDIMMDDHNPLFLMDGEPIDDWDKRVGDSILVDFFRLCPPGVDPILYVRNHRTDEDYEVVQVSP